MSVSNPVGSGGGLVAFDRDLQGMAEQMNTVGGWAEIMAQDSLNNTVDEEETKEEEVEKSVSETRSERSFDRNRIPEHPPYCVQITNVPSNCDADDLFLFFGGEEKIVDMDLHADRNRANIEFIKRDYMLDLWEKSRNFKLDFQGTKLKLFILQNRAERKEEKESYSRQNSNFKEPYSRQSSRYNSQSSIASDARYDRRYDHRDYGRNEHYGTMPPPGRGYSNDFRGGRGSFRGGRGGNRGYGGPPRGGGYYGGDLQRSESYTHDRDRPAPINRSRTDSMGMDRRQSDLQSRASSQFSLNNDEPKPVVKKPSHSDIFGDAKPVNTMSKLEEIEKKIEEEKKQREKAEKEAVKHQQQQQQQQQQMMMSHPPPNHNNHPHYPPGGFRPQQFSYSMPPPTFYSTGPVFATPVVPHYGPHHHHPSQYQEQMSPRFEGGHVGTVKIMQRSDADRDSVSAANTSPPLDPEHPEPRKEAHPSPVKESTTNQSISQDSVKSEVIHRGGRGGFRGGVRTFSNSAHKSSSYDGQRGSVRGRGRGAGRGTYHNARNDTPTVAESPAEKNNNNKENATGQEEPGLHRENREHHGSQSSLKSRGQGRPSRGNRGGGSDRGGRGGYHKDRPPRNRDDRPPYNKDEVQKGDGQKDQRPPASKKDEEKPQNKGAAPKAEVKEVPAKEPQTPKAAQEVAEVATPNSETNQKKSKKKKNAAKATVNNMMNGNKFAALLNTTDD